MHSQRLFHFLFGLCVLATLTETRVLHPDPKSLVSDNDFHIVMDCVKEHNIPLPDGSAEITEKEWKQWTPVHSAYRILEQQLVVLQCIEKIFPDDNDINEALKEHNL